MVLMSALTERKKKSSIQQMTQLWNNLSGHFKLKKTIYRLSLSTVLCFFLTRLTRLLEKREREKTKQNNPYLEGAMLGVVFKKRITEHF